MKDRKIGKLINEINENKRKVIQFPFFHSPLSLPKKPISCYLRAPFNFFKRKQNAQKFLFFSPKPTHQLPRVNASLSVLVF